MRVIWHSSGRSDGVRRLSPSYFGIFELLEQFLRDFESAVNKIRQGLRHPRRQPPVTMTTFLVIVAAILFTYVLLKVIWPGLGSP